MYRGTLTNSWGEKKEKKIYWCAGIPNITNCQVNICESKALLAAKKVNNLLKEVGFYYQFTLDTNMGMWFVAELSNCYEVCAEAGCFFCNLD